LPPEHIFVTSSGHFNKFSSKEL